MKFALLPLLWMLALPAVAALAPQWQQELQQLTEQAARAALPPHAELEVQLGAPDPRLRLAPCEQVQAFVPPGQSLWGRSRIGLRCVAGAVRWSISVPVQVRVFAPAWAATQALPAGVTLEAAHLERRRVELSAEASPALAQAEPPLGRVLARPLESGEGLRQSHLRQRLWFAAGAPVQLRLAGSGFAVKAEGQAMAPGLDGQPVRVRLDNGRTVLGQAVGPNEVELAW